MSLVRSPVEAALLERVLRPYKDGCRYLREAQIEFDSDAPLAPVRLYGELSIDRSCYIDDTGHFNSVEFNLCYNQLIYSLMAQCVVAGNLPAFGAMTLAEYFERQLPDVLIHCFSSKFKRPMDPRAFSGVVTIRSAVRRGGFILLDTECSFHDSGKGSCSGEVSLAIVERSARSHSAGNGQVGLPETSRR